jgi:hypothetical protein
MPRVFASLAAANVLLLVASGTVGLFDTGPGAERHVLLAVLTLLLSCFVQVVTFTYLTVTGKMIGQAVHLARLDPAILTLVRAYKKTMTRSLAVVFLAVVFVTATGASGWRLGGATLWHRFAAMVVLVAHLWAFLREYEVVVANARLLDQTLKNYETARNR